MEAWSGGGGEGDGTSRRSQHTLGIGLGLGRRWGAGGCCQPRTLRPGPHLSLYSAARWGPISQENGWEPRSGRGSRAQLAVGPT